MSGYHLQTDPVRIPTTDDKVIEEHFGAVSISAGDYSFAHMIAPPQWSEPFQEPDFDEVTYVISGKKRIEVYDEEIVLKKNQSICIQRGTRVRYSNPFDEPCEYVSICIPAFTPERVKRDAQ